jgi:hypothetical protein
MRIGCGSYRRRLETLDPEAHAACLELVRVRWAELGPDDFVFRPEVVFAIGRRPAGV